MRGRMVPRNPRGRQSTGISHASLTARLGFRPRGARHICFPSARWMADVPLFLCQRSVIYLESCLGKLLLLEATRAA